MIGCLQERRRLQHMAAGGNICAIADWFCADRPATRGLSLLWVDVGIQVLAIEAGA